MDVAPDSTVITKESSPLLNSDGSVNFTDCAISNENSQACTGIPMKIPNGTREVDRSRKVVEGKRDGFTQSLSYTNMLRIIKVISLLLIGACGLFGLVFSKITFVSITSRMYTLYSRPSAQHEITRNHKSTIFFQLVFILIIPEIVCLGHCLLWGFVGKSSKNKPWPSWKAINLVSIYVRMHACI